MKWLQRLKWMRISKIAILVCLVLSTIFAGFTIYGNKVGNFVVNIQNSTVKIGASMQEDLGDLSSRLSVPALRGQGAASYVDIPKNIADGIGSKNDNTYLRYMAFSFYLVNQSDRAVDYDISLMISDLVGKADDILRVLIIDGSDGAEEIFAKPEASDEAKAYLERNTDYRTTDFFSDSQIMAKRVTDFQPDTRIKYTVVFWMEGWDVDCTDERLNDRIKLRMDFVGH